MASVSSTSRSILGIPRNRTRRGRMQLYSVTLWNSSKSVVAETDEVAVKLAHGTLGHSFECISQTFPNTRFDGRLFLFGKAADDDNFDWEVIIYHTLSGHMGRFNLRLRTGGWHDVFALMHDC